MDERELTQLLQRAGDRVTPGPAPVAAIVREGDALRRQQRRGRVVLVRATAIAAAVVGGGSLAATVVDFPSLSGGSETSADAGSAAGGGASSDAGNESAEGSPENGGTDSGAEAEGEERATADELAAATAAPSMVSAGDRIVVRDDDDPSNRYDRVWRMERLSQDGWVDEYRLFAASRNGDEDWIEAGEPYDSLDAGGVEGPARLVVPPVAEPGEYRVCEENSGNAGRCASVIVRE